MKLVLRSYKNITMCRVAIIAYLCLDAYTKRCREARRHYGKWLKFVKDNRYDGSFTNLIKFNFFKDYSITR